jgi:hypothetical protein
MTDGTAALRAHRDRFKAHTERFQSDTAGHRMTVLHDDGLYRHLRFARPETGLYWFDLVTWAGHLSFTGDGQAFTFARTRDMFEFFRSSSGYGINPTYWSEKLVTGHKAAESYSTAVFDERVADVLAEAENTYPGVTAAWKEHVHDHDTSYEQPARDALDDFTFLSEDAPQTLRPFRFVDTWEWNLKSWDWWFLWACHAIVWGIGQYDAARAEPSTEAVTSSV